MRQMGGRAALERYVSQKIPMGRFATAEEIAESVLFLASDRTAFMTGQASSSMAEKVWADGLQIYRRRVYPLPLDLGPAKWKAVHTARISIVCITGQSFCFRAAKSAARR